MQQVHVAFVPGDVTKTHAANGRFTIVFRFKNIRFPGNYNYTLVFENND